MDGALRRWKSRVNEEGDDLPDRAEPADLLERSMSDDGERRPSDPLWDRSKPTSGAGATAAMFMADTFRRIVCWRKASLKCRSFLGYASVVSSAWRRGASAVALH